MFNNIMIAAFVFSALGVSSYTFADDNEEIMFDTDTEQYLFDTDNDTFPDLTEELAGTDPYDADSVPSFPEEDEQNEISSGHAKSGVQRSSCLSGYYVHSLASRLCISWPPRGPRNYTSATVDCRKQGARVTTHEDLVYMYLQTDWDRFLNPVGRWIGNIVGDNAVMVGNRDITFNNDPDIWNFDGITDKFTSRYYICAHDKS